MLFTLNYRGSKDGWKSEDFHQRCDNKGPSISLFRMKDGDCIGGFTVNSWSSPDFWECKSDKRAFLFNLTKQRQFTCKNFVHAIVCDRDFGPNFGWGELEAIKDPFDQENAFKSCANRENYKIPLDKTELNMLTNLKNDSSFTISEVEIWGVKFIYR